MTRITLAALTASAALGACGVPDPVLEGERTPLVMVSPGIGDLVLTREGLVLDDGSLLPVREVGSGVFALPTRPVKLPNGTDICSGQAVGYMTLHRTADGLIAMNFGDWPSPPEPPPADTEGAPGACAAFTYRPA